MVIMWIVQREHNLWSKSLIDFVLVLVLVLVPVFVFVLVFRGDERGRKDSISYHTMFSLIGLACFAVVWCGLVRLGCGSLWLVNLWQLSISISISASISTRISSSISINIGVSTGVNINKIFSLVSV
ncbi:hypothetical protein F4703DRAFT_1791783 [Phycomyces blakesleeanus]